jgi:hypothetical protein
VPIQNPKTPYDRAYNAWSYGGGQQRGEPMPRARDFPPEPGGMGGQTDARAPYGAMSGGPPLAPFAYDPRTSPPRQNPWLMPDQPVRDPRSGSYKAAIREQHGGVRDEEQRRLAESPAVVQRARAYGQRRRQPRSSGTSLGALNRR